MSASSIPDLVALLPRLDCLDEAHGLRATQAPTVAKLFALGQVNTHTDADRLHLVVAIRKHNTLL